MPRPPGGSAGGEGGAAGLRHPEHRNAAHTRPCAQAECATVPAVDLVDETWIAAEPEQVATVAHDPARWRAWWPDLDLVVFQDRGVDGLRWSCTGALVGSCELWLEPWTSASAALRGVIVHHYLRADPTHRGSRIDPVEAIPLRRAVALRAERSRRWKRAVHAWKDEMERTAPLAEAGEPAQASSDSRSVPTGSV